jgi:hypothetical protein
MPDLTRFDDFKKGQNAARQALFVWLIFSAAGLWPGQKTAGSPPTAESDRWYILKMAENAVGYLHEIVQDLPADAASNREHILRTDSEMRLVLNRLGSRVEIRFESSAEESGDGYLRRTSYEMLASSLATRAKANIGKGTIELKTEAGGKVYSSTLSYTGNLFGPEGIRRTSAAQLKKPGDQIALQTFMAEASIVGNLSRVMLGSEVISLGGKELKTSKIEEVLEGMPVKRTVWLDEAGYIVKQEEPGPFGAMTILSSDKATALAAAGGAELPKEMYQSSIARTNIRLPRAHPVERLRLRLIHKNPSLGWPDFAAPNQTILEKKEKELILEIRQPKPAGGADFPVAVSEENREYLLPNAYIQSDDAEVQKVARELVQGEKDVFKAALTLRRWVSGNMKFDLGIVFAPSNEIFRNRRGTCVGYATLLATLARAAGIPSRVVMGYVYALGMFGGHAWTEVLAGKEWIPLDAAIVNEGAADATRFYFIASPLADGPGELSFGAAQQVFGQIAIHILEYEAAGKTVVVPENAPAYSVEGDNYDNPWLGLRFSAPDGAAFSRLDAVWPDPTIAGLTWPDGTSGVLVQDEIPPWQDVENVIKNKLAALAPQGRAEKLKTKAWEDVFMIDSPGGKKSAAAFLRGSELFIWTVEGKEAPRLLRLLSESFRIN